MIVIIGQRSLLQQKQVEKDWFDLLQGRDILKSLNVGCMEHEDLHFIFTLEGIERLIKEKTPIRICLIMESSLLIRIGIQATDSFLRLITNHCFVTFPAYRDFFVFLLGNIITPNNIQLAHSQTSLKQLTHIGNVCIPPSIFHIPRFGERLIDDPTSRIIENVALSNVSERMSLGSDDMSNFLLKWLTWTLTESFSKQSDNYITTFSNHPNPPPLNVMLANEDLYTSKIYTLPFNKVHLLRERFNREYKEYIKIWKPIYPSMLQTKNLTHLLTPPSIDGFLAFLT